MSDPFVGEIRIFAGTFAPRSWAFCDGQLLSIIGNEALFSLLGTIYGGDGRTTFGLPDMRGRLPMHQGTGPGLSNRRLGNKSGVENVTLNSTQLASHSHGLGHTYSRADVASPVDAVLARSAAGDLQFIDHVVNAGSMASEAIGNTGQGGAHNNMPPYQCVNFIIALFGTYPSRS